MTDTAPKIKPLPHAAQRLAERFGFTRDPMAVLRVLERKIIDGKAIRASGAGNQCCYWVERGGSVIYCVWNPRRCQIITVQTVRMRAAPYSKRMRKRERNRGTNGFEGKRHG